MRINVNELRNELDGTMSFQWGLLAPEDFKDRIEDIVVTFTAKYTDESILIKGYLSMVYKTQCGRCIKPTSIKVGEKFEEEFRRGSPPQPEETEIVLEKEDLSVDYFTGNYLELDDYFRQVIILSIPDKVLCRKDCPGLCPECGQDLSIADCGCQKESVDPRLKKLEKFKEIIQEN
ncbi:YceD family protein [Natranaerofaba carboxydovora]|uniref:YceD family protein n=1 Tax=Natranaerofaba carboxydovora TaxID=2742683 RepID=UPI001F143653|nr:DUF177 domain-containing protein [Natranaerofaba carboxydovora]UMZ73319.1 putative ACR [Natranaerofaba carboxydovora]